MPRRQRLISESLHVIREAREWGLDLRVVRNGEARSAS
jgi:hypothetical protein